MTEAVEAIIKYGFETLNLNRIEALTSDKNTASVKVIEGRGFTKEGRLRKHYFVGEAHEDSIMYSLLQEEYVRMKRGERIR